MSSAAMIIPAAPLTAAGNVPGNMRVLQSRVGKWLVGLGFWTLLGLSFAGQFYISSAKAGLEVSWRQAVSYALWDWYVFALLSLPVIRLAKVVPLATPAPRPFGLWPLGVHALASVCFSLAYMVLRATVGAWQSNAGFVAAFKPLLVKTWHFNLLIYWVIVAVTQAFEYYRKYRERELRASELEKRLAQAKLQALQMQLNPHFLFNTLHSISALMHKDVEAADRMVMQLSDLLRSALDSSNTQEVPLRDELQMLDLYLGIEKIRFGDRLTVKVDIAPELLTAQVPNLILQPLVENAIRHGIEPRARPGRIELRARRQQGSLALEVSDNGNGLSRSAAGPGSNHRIGTGAARDATLLPTREGVGLSNTRARLKELYGQAHAFELQPGPEGGLQVRLTIPFREAPSLPGPLISGLP